MFLSVIVPLHNGARTIKRTLDSIVDLHFNDLEVIVVNDASTDNSLEIVGLYKDILPLNLIESDFDFHCAGNTRQSGMNHANGDWITFIDLDDEFLPNAFNEVKRIIEEENLLYYCATIMILLSESIGWVNKLYPTDHDNPDPWLHGKFYNRINLIEKYDIKFKKDLYFLEDIYFNKLVVDKLFINDLLDDTNYHYHLVETYKWYFDLPTCTHDKLTKEKYTHNDWGLANHYCEIICPFYVDFLLHTKNPKIIEKLIKTYLASIFYVYSAEQFFIEKYGKDDKIISILKETTKKYTGLLWELGLKDGDIVEYMWKCIDDHVNPEFVSNIYEDPLVWLAELKQSYLNEHHIDCYLMAHEPIKNDAVIVEE